MPSNTVESPDFPSAAQPPPPVHDPPAADPAALQDRLDQLESRLSELTDRIAVEPAVYWTKKETAAWLKVDQRTIPRLVAARSIPAPVYVGNQPRWSRTAVISAVAAGAAGAKRDQPKGGAR